MDSDNFNGQLTKNYGNNNKILYKASNLSVALDILLRQNKINQNGAAMQVESVLREGEEEKAALIMSARDMVDKITGWLEDVASMKSETMLELVDSIRDELGSEVSAQFSGKTKPALDELYTALETSRTTMAQAVAILTGEEAPGMGAESPEGMPAELGAEAMPTGDDFAAAEPAAGGEEAAGRMKRESVEYSRKLGTILSQPKKK